MPALPAAPLHKAALRSLLGNLAASSATEPTQWPANLRDEREWAIAAGLANEQGLTAEGQLVAAEDPYLETTVTDWLIHGHLSLGDTRFDRGNVWQYFVYEFLPNHSSFSQNDLLNACTETFPILSSAALQKLVRLVLNTYIDGQAIAKNRFLILNQKQYSTGQSDLSNPYTVGYLLAKTWERDFQSRQAVLVDEIIDTERGLASLLGVNQEQLRQHLDILATHSLIEQRSAKPHLSTLKPPLREAGESSYQVYRCWETPIELLKKAYEADQATPNQPLSKALEGILQDSDDDVPDFSQFLEWASGLIPQPGDIRLEIGLAS